MPLFITSDNLSSLVLRDLQQIQGGIYYSRLGVVGSRTNEDIFIQTPRCSTKDGIVKYEKRFLCELIFNCNRSFQESFIAVQPALLDSSNNLIKTQDDEQDSINEDDFDTTENSEHIAFITLFRNVIETIKNLIFHNSIKWFQSSISKNDIDLCFHSPLKPFKKTDFILETFISPSKKTDTSDKLDEATSLIPVSVPNLIVYDEEQKDKSVHDFVANSNLIGLIQLKGVKIINSIIYLEISLSQAMIFKEIQATTIPKFISHSIDSIQSTLTAKPNQFSQPANSETNTNTTTLNELTSLKSESDSEQPNQLPKQLIIENSVSSTSMDSDIAVANSFLTANSIPKKSQKTNNNTIISTATSVDSNSKEDFDNSELAEIDIFNDENDDEIIDDNSFELQQPTMVYYELYKTLLKRASRAFRLYQQELIDAENFRRQYNLPKIDISSFLSQNGEEPSTFSLNQNKNVNFK